MNRIDLKNARLWTVPLLLLLSGLCALVFQVGWLRELRLVFGGSTLAMAVVLAIFMGGLGFGGLFWGRIADRHENPLKLYAYFEIGIAVLAAASPFLLSLVRFIYLSLGGSMAMGPFFALLVRIAASAVVLGLPTFLMGGTLPAVVRALETESDLGRRRMALLYGINTLGGVAGVMVATFFLLELLGTRLTIWSGSLLNLLVGLAALFLAGKTVSIPGGELHAQAQSNSAPAPEAEKSAVSGAAALPPYFVYAAAFLAGFAFFIMEIVWNRMLTPLLGGSVYSFGLVIAVVLTGIGIGGWLYSLGDRRVPATVSALAATLALEALALVIPFALGDRLAVLTVLLRQFGSLGFGGLILGWSVVTSLVVLPASLVAGFQFPLLVNLLGRGRRDVGQHTGRIYAWNTFGAITGLLAGGLGFISLLSAPGCWLLAVVLLCLLGGAATVLSVMKQRGRLLPALSVLVIGTTLFLSTAEGPTAVWRHTPIGVGQISFTNTDRTFIRDWMNQARRVITWEADGKESSIALRAYDALAFVINGKIDGNAVGDAGTQIMGPFIGAILHPAPQKALVIGLGTGQSGGWLADINSMQQVDVMELEPAMLEVALRSSPSNRNVLENPKVRMIIGDARESLMTSRETYDIIFSEPSNPYRAGIASLYTREFYQAVFENLHPDGYFSQWVQAYDVDSETLYTIAATLASVFPEVEIWQSSETDLIFVCSKKKNGLSSPVLRNRLQQEPFKSAMLAGWGVEDLEGFLAAKLAGSGTARVIKERYVQKGLINSDDRMLVEFGLARSTGLVHKPSLAGFRRSLQAADSIRPVWAEEFPGIDWARVNRSYSVMFPGLIEEMLSAGDQSQDLLNWRYAYTSFLNQDHRTILSGVRSGNWQPEYPLELAIIAQAAAQLGDESAIDWAEKLSKYSPVEANVILARYLWRIGDAEKAYTYIEAAFLKYRKDPWPHQLIMGHGLDLAAEMALANLEIGAKLYDLLLQPFSVYNLEERRFLALVKISYVLGCRYAAEVFELMEPYVPFNQSVLEYRARCYGETGSPHLEQARRDLEELRKDLPTPFTGYIR